jgi:hypothetical protein
MRLSDLLTNLDGIQEGDIFVLELDDIVVETTIIGMHTDGPIISIDDIALAYLPITELNEAEYHGHKVTLGKPFLTPDGPKKRSVYVKNPNGNIAKVNFGDKTMRIKKSNPARRRSYRARHHCDNPGPRTKANYWSCRSW